MLFLPHNRLYCLLLLLLPALACRKQTVITGESAASSLSAVFDAFWNKMNTNYVYWNIDSTHWDDMYRLYRPQFAILDINNPNDCRKAVGLFRQMTDGLTDAHYFIRFLPPAIKDSFVFPALDRKQAMPGFHAPFNYAAVDAAYLDSGYQTASYQAADNTSLSVMSGLIQHRILYFSCNRFSLQEAWQKGHPGVTTVLQYFFSRLQQPASPLRAVIVDVRNNSGGNIADLSFFLGRFISRPLAFGFTRYKSDNGRFSYTPWISASVTPAAGASGSALPVYVLADNYSVSLAEAMVMAIKAMPGSLFIGELTWGATGPVTGEAVYNDGQFTIPSFLSVTTSSAQFKYLNGQVYEGHGFPPDKLVSFNAFALSFGDDPALDTAIARVH